MSSIWWSKEEVSKLIELEKQETISKEELLELFPQRTLKSICGKKKSLKLKLSIIKRPIPNSWKKYEDDVIRKFYFLPNDKEEICKRLPHRKWYNVNRRATSLGLRKLNIWTEEEEEKLKDIYYNNKDAGLKLAFPHRSMEAIDLHANNMGLRKGYKNIQESDLSILLNETPETYYWIGFILADGHISEKYRLTFALAKKDKTSVEKFASFIKSPNIRENKRCFSVSAQNQDVLPEVCKKFDIHHLKTYYPPRLDFISNPNLLLSLIIGYIDGDGCIKNLSKRKDFAIALHVHSSWINILTMFEKTLYNILDIKKRKNILMSRIGNDKYARLNIGDSRLCKKLKQKALELKLPIMERKWDKVDLNFISKQETADKRKNEVLNLYFQGKNVTEISKLLSLGYGCIYSIIRTNDKNQSI